MNKYNYKMDESRLLNFFFLQKNKLKNFYQKKKIKILN